MVHGFNFVGNDKINLLRVSRVLLEVKVAERGVLVAFDVHPVHQSYYRPLFLEKQPHSSVEEWEVRGDLENTIDGESG
jgi:hypothetical protein